MRPGRRLLRIVTMLCIVSLLVPIAPMLAGWIGIAFLVVLIAALLEAVALRRLTVSNLRPGRIAIALDEEEEVPFSLTTDSQRAVHLIIRQVWPRLLDALAETRAGFLRPGEVLRFDAQVRGVTRGSATLEAPAVAATFWHLAERILPAGKPTEIAVIPNTRAVGRLHRHLNDYVLRGMGSRVSPRMGRGREFDRLRDYVSGDDYRDIAWRASARHNKLIVREFRIERAQETILCIDRGHRMAARVARISRLDHAVNAALLLSYLCNRMEDRIAVTSFAEDADRGIPVGRGATQMRRITGYLTDLQPGYRFTDYVALAARLRRGLRHRSLIMMFTVLPEPQERVALLRAVHMLAPQHLPVIIVLSDPDLDAAAATQPANREELAQVLVARDLRSGRVTLMQELRHSGALVVETAPNETSTAAVNAYIDVKRRQLL